MFFPLPRLRLIIRGISRFIESSYSPHSGCVIANGTFGRLTKLDGESSTVGGLHSGQRRPEKGERLVSRLDNRSPEQELILAHLPDEDRFSAEPRPNSAGICEQNQGTAQPWTGEFDAQAAARIISGMATLRREETGGCRDAAAIIRTLTNSRIPVS